MMKYLLTKTAIRIRRNSFVCPYDTWVISGGGEGVTHFNGDVKISSTPPVGNHNNIQDTTKATRDTTHNTCTHT